MRYLVWILAIRTSYCLPDTEYRKARKALGNYNTLERNFSKYVNISLINTPCPYFTSKLKDWNIETCGSCL